MMPTAQRCPQCGNLFIGSDAIGDMCLDCKGVTDVSGIMKDALIKQLKQRLAAAEAERDAARTIAADFFDTLCSMSQGLPGLESWAPEWTKAKPWLLTAKSVDPPQPDPAMVARSLDDIEHGQVQPIEEVIEELRKEAEAEPLPLDGDTPSEPTTPVDGEEGKRDDE